MITLDAVRAVLAVPDPYAAMDRLIRSEMAAGRRVRDIYDALGSLADRLLATPGLTEHGREALLGTLDALTENCDPDQCYYDPPDVGPVIPTSPDPARQPG